jgi:hypothetical protein
MRKHRMIKLAALTLFCVAATFAHAAPPFQEQFDVSNLVLDQITGDGWMDISSRRSGASQRGTLRSSRRGNVASDLA